MQIKKEEMNQGRMTGGKEREKANETEDEIRGEWTDGR